MATSYWNSVLAGRLNRRRALAATGATSLGAVLLAACGGDGKGSSSKKDSSGLVTPDEDTSAKAVPGGTMQGVQQEEAVGLEPLVGTSSTASVRYIKNTYDRLLWRTPGLNGAVGPISGNAAESFEVAPDGLTITMKLRQNHTWDPRPPTNGRAMTTKDVQWSWDRFINGSTTAGDLYAGKNKSAPFLSMSTPDDRTIVFKVGSPSRSNLDLLADDNYLHLMPIELENFNTKGEARGSGPWMLQQWRSSIDVQYKKKPGWWFKGHPFLDGYTETLIPDYAAALAQFKQGAVWRFPQIRQEDVLSLKRAQPSLVMRQTHAVGNIEQGRLLFSQQADSPMKDVRVRRATSMLLDRDLWIRVFYGTEDFEAAGIPITINWNSSLPAEYSQTLRPNLPDDAKKLGEGAQYYQYNVNEAKKLIAASGYTGKVLNYYSSKKPDTARKADVTKSFLDVGLKTQYEQLDTNTAFRDVCQNGSGMLGFSGLCSDTGSAFNAEQYLATCFLPESKHASFREDVHPEFIAMVRKIRNELDAQKQTDLIYDAQRWAALNFPHLSYPGHALEFTLNWPWLENYGVFEPGNDGFTSPDYSITWWYNKSKDPKATA